LTTGRHPAGTLLERIGEKMIINKASAACGALALCIAMLGVLGQGCSSSSPSSLPRADIRGTVVSISTATPGAEAGPIGSVLIDGASRKANAVDKASVTVTGKTRIYAREGAKLVQVSFASLRLGQEVQATFDGPVLESYPVQATASGIVILSETGGPE
jgi:hypothetical protein